MGEWEIVDITILRLPKIRSVRIQDLNGRMGEREFSDKTIHHFCELRIYRMAFVSAERIFELSKKWPVAERFSLIDQIRRSSRSVCGSVAQAEISCALCQ